MSWLNGSLQDLHQLFREQQVLWTPREVKYRKSEDCVEKCYRGVFGVSLVGLCADLEQHSAVLGHHQGMSIPGLFAGLWTLCP